MCLNVVFFCSLVIFLPLFAQPLLHLTATDIDKGTFHTDDNRGYADELLQEAYTRVGYRLKVTSLPSERSLKMANSGKSDGEFLRVGGIEKRYTNLIQISEPIANLEAVVFSYNSLDLRNNWAALEGNEVGLVIGIKFVEANMPVGAIVTRVKNVEQLFHLLQAKRIAYAVYPRKLGEKFIRDNSMDDISVLEPPLASEPLFTYLNKKHSHLVPELTKALREMKQDGTFQRITQKHKPSSFRG